MVNALFKLAADHGLSVRDAARVIRLSEDTRTPYRYWIKEAGPAEEQQQPPPEAGGQDPSMPGVPMAPPPQPSGFELALAERQQILSQQMQALQMEMQSLGELSMRAQMIDSGGGAMAAVGGLLAGNPDALISGVTGKFGAMSIRKVSELGWKPLHFITSGVSSLVDAVSSTTSSWRHNDEPPTTRARTTSTCSGRRG